jgi:MGT family glycosyltransferase
VWNVLHTDLSGTTPPCFFSWPHRTTAAALTRNRKGVKAAGEIFAPLVPLAMAYAEQRGLRIDWSDPGATISRLVVISQTPREFDFPGIPWPPHFHYTGPFHDGDGREAIDFPCEKLTGRPLVYASMGTLVNGRAHVYRALLQAVGRLPHIQVVLEVGKNVGVDDVGSVPPNAIVVDTAPQIALLKRAALCITHAGLNTALESLAQGVPMVAIPVGYDQPGVAARIAHHGVGEFVELEDVSVGNVQRLIQRVLEQPEYREKARWFRKVIAQTRGLDVAADVIEQAFGMKGTRIRADRWTRFDDAEQR